MDPPIEQELAKQIARAEARAERRIARIRARTQARIQQLRLPRGKRFLFRVAAVVLATVAVVTCALLTDTGRSILRPSNLRRALAPGNVTHRVRALAGADTFADESARARRDAADAFDKFYREDERQLLTVAGYDPETALFVRANFDAVLAFSPEVMELDDTRGYRFRPNARAVWVEGKHRDRGTDYFLMPESTKVRSLVGRTKGWQVMPGSEESYNQFGLRSNEPDPDAASTGVLLGDSFMECPLVERSQTVAAHLDRLSAADGMPMQWINTGHPGYSTDQQYHTLVWLHEKCCGNSAGLYKKPAIVVLNVYANDVHNRSDAVMQDGAGDWDQFQQWVAKIREYCHRHEMQFVVCVVPGIAQIRAPMRTSLRNYQQQVAIAANMTPLRFVDPLHEMSRDDARLSQLTGQPDPLYAPNMHFSAAGCECYARHLWQTLRVVLRQDAAGDGVPEASELR
jgi:hypothetical protein